MKRWEREREAVRWLERAGASLSPSVARTNAQVLLAERERYLRELDGLRGQLEDANVRLIDCERVARACSCPEPYGRLVEGRTWPHQAGCPASETSRRHRV